MVRSRLPVGALLWAVTLAVPGPVCAVEPPAAPEARAESFVEVLHGAEAKSRGREWAEAAALWARVVEMNPSEGDYWAQLATARRSAGDDRGAIPALEKALELRAGFPWSSAYDIARCYARLGEKEPALRWLERALDMGYRYLRRAQTEADFESLRGDPRYRRLVLLADVSKMSRNEGLRYDLGLLAREIKRLHYAPFRQVSQREFDAYVRKLHDAIPRLTDPQIAVGFMKLARMAGDGHTHIDPVFMQSGKRAAAPVQFYLFTEGLFIIGTTPGHTDLLGAQLLRIGDHTVEEVMAALDPVISRDNTLWPKRIGPSLMRYPRLLNGLGLIPDPARMPLTIRGSDGKVRTVSLAADTGDPTDAWETARREASVADPLYLKNRRAAYWFEYLSAERTVYFQYNSVQNLPREPMEKFCDAGKHLGPPLAKLVAARLPDVDRAAPLRASLVRPVPRQSGPRAGGDPRLP